MGIYGHPFYYKQGLPKVRAMKNKFQNYIFTVLLLLVTTAIGQTRDNYSDELLTSSFKLFQSADFELANHMLPFLRERFIKELKDTSSFTNPYDSLSKYIGIKYSSDSLLKTYCWSERSGSCCHTSATFAQFKTKSGEIKYIDLEEAEDHGVEIFITDVQTIEIDENPYYLILGRGSCCGGKHYEVARVYEISNDTLIKSDSVFNHETEVYVGANRSREIDLNYSPESRILSYKSYVFDDASGFYRDEQSEVKWKLTKKGFKKMN